MVKVNSDQSTAGSTDALSPSDVFNGMRDAIALAMDRNDVHTGILRDNLRALLDRADASDLDFASLEQALIEDMLRPLMGGEHALRDLDGLTETVGKVRRLNEFCKQVPGTQIRFLAGCEVVEADKPEFSTSGDVGYMGVTLRSPSGKSEPAILDLTTGETLLLGQASYIQQCSVSLDGEAYVWVRQVNKSQPSLYNLNTRTFVFAEGALGDMSTGPFFLQNGQTVIGTSRPNQDMIFYNFGTSKWLEGPKTVVRSTYSSDLILSENGTILAVQRLEDDIRCGPLAERVVDLNSRKTINLGVLEAAQVKLGKGSLGASFAAIRPAGDTRFFVRDLDSKRNIVDLERNISTVQEFVFGPKHQAFILVGLAGDYHNHYLINLASGEIVLTTKESVRFGTQGFARGFQLGRMIYGSGEEAYYVGRHPTQSSGTQIIDLSNGDIHVHIPEEIRIRDGITTFKTADGGKLASFPCDCASGDTWESGNFLWQVGSKPELDTKGDIVGKGIPFRDIAGNIWQSKLTWPSEGKCEIEVACVDNGTKYSLDTLQGTGPMEIFTNRSGDLHVALHNQSRSGLEFAIFNVATQAEIVRGPIKHGPYQGTLAMPLKIFHRTGGGAVIMKPDNTGLMVA